MAQIKRLSDGALITVASSPVWVAGIWECGDQRFTDAMQTLYQAVVTLPLLTPVQFYDALTPVEETAILGSTDPLVQAFARRLSRALNSGTMIDPNLTTVQEGLAYLSLTAQQPATTPASTYILPARVAQILAGSPQ